MEDVNKAMEAIKSLVGLMEVKSQFEQYLDSIHVCRQRGEDFRHKHMAFLGNPGTGKTTVARLLCKILYEYGVLSKDQLRVVTPADLVGEFVGSTASKTRAICEQAHGGILFIDEAYGIDCVLGREALSMLILFMTEDTDTIVIFAGYPDEMKFFLGNSNPGLIRRISHIINFEDFTNEELTDIFRRKLIEEDYIIGEDALAQAKAYFASLKRGKAFGNARESERLLSKVRSNQARRLATKTNPSTDDVFTILPQDIPTENEE